MQVQHFHLHDIAPHQTCKYRHLSCTPLAVAGQGFPRRGGYQPLNLGQKPIVWQEICQKLHENEKKNWIEKGRVPGAPFDLSMPWVVQ